MCRLLREQVNYISYQMKYNCWHEFQVTQYLCWPSCEAKPLQRGSVDTVVTKRKTSNFFRFKDVLCRDGNKWVVKGETESSDEEVNIWRSGLVKCFQLRPLMCKPRPPLPLMQLHVCSKPSYFVFITGQRVPWSVPIANRSLPRCQGCSQRLSQLRNLSMSRWVPHLEIC